MRKSRMLFTGKSQHEDTKEGSRSFDLLRAIRSRRLTWLGHILHMDDKRLLARAVRHQSGALSEGDILADAPETEAWDELKAWAQDRKMEDAGSRGETRQQDSSVIADTFCIRIVQVYSNTISSYYSNTSTVSLHCSMHTQ